DRRRHRGPRPWGARPSGRRASVQDRRAAWNETRKVLGNEGQLVHRGLGPARAGLPPCTPQAGPASGRRGGGGAMSTPPGVQRRWDKLWAGIDPVTRTFIDDLARSGEINPCYKGDARDWLVACRDAGVSTSLD